jgi:hypothetical protein
MLPGTNCAADVIRNVSVHYGLTTPDQPNISSTRWRTVVDHKRKLYFFGADQDHTSAGNATGEFKGATPFRYLGLRRYPFGASFVR